MSRMAIGCMVTLAGIALLLLVGCADARLSRATPVAAMEPEAAYEAPGAPYEVVTIAAEAPEARASRTEACEPCEREECEERCDPNKLSLFLGYSTERGEGGGTVGLSYERRISRLFGVGGFAEHVFGELDVTALGAGLYVHPREPWVLFAGAGVEIEHDGEERFLVRVGGAYEFPLRRGLSVAPALYVDFLEGGDPVFVLGVEIGKGW